jgi:hypothetical protein
LRKSRLAAGEQHQGNSSFQAEVHCGFRTIERSGIVLAGQSPHARARGRGRRAGPLPPLRPRRPLAPLGPTAAPRDPIDLGGPMCPMDPGAALQTFRAQADCDSRGPGPGPAQTAQGPLGDSPARRVGSWLAADVLARINDHAIHRLSQLFATELGERVGAS